jgi:hypothetical protein
MLPGWLKAMPTQTFSAVKCEMLAFDIRMLCNQSHGMR